MYRQFGTWIVDSNHNTCVRNGTVLKTSKLAGEMMSKSFKSVFENQAIYRQTCPRNKTNMWYSAFSDYLPRDVIGIGSHKRRFSGSPHFCYQKISTEWKRDLRNAYFTWPLKSNLKDNWLINILCLIIRMTSFNNKTQRPRDPMGILADSVLYLHVNFLSL